MSDLKNENGAGASNTSIASSSSKSSTGSSSNNTTGSVNTSIHIINNLKKEETSRNLTGSFSSAINRLEIKRPLAKIGKIIPNRVFIGGLTPDTNETDLQTVFAQYGNVKYVKIIYDRQGISKGYGFITYEKVEDAIRLQNETTSIVIKNNKVKISKAVKKQPVFDLYRTNNSLSAMPLSMQLERMNATALQNSTLPPLAYFRALHHNLLSAVVPNNQHHNSLCGLPPPPLSYGMFMPPPAFPKSVFGKTTGF